MNQNYEDFLAATTAFAENLACSEPIVAFQIARRQLDEDKLAQSLLQQLSQLQSELRNAQARGTVTQADIERLRELQHQAQSNPSINLFASTQQSAVTYLREINQEISALLSVDFADLARPTGGCC